MKAAERISEHLHPMLCDVRADPSREAEFWNDVARMRTPLVEADPASSEHSVVTYVWKLRENARHVVLQPGFGDTTHNVMERIDATRVCHATYRYRNDVRTSYSFMPDMPLISWEKANAKELAELHAFLTTNKAQHDPHGREQFVSRAGAGEPDLVTSVLALHDAIDESAAHKRQHVARGVIGKHLFASTLLRNERNVWIYTPPGYATSDRAYPVLVIFDGGNALTQIPVHRMLDNLFADGRIEPIVGVFIDNPTPESRNDELPSLWWGPGYRIDVPRSEGGYTPEWLIGKFAESPR
jgi:enterochelin esterase family protein